MLQSGCGGGVQSRVVQHRAKELAQQADQLLALSGAQVRSEPADVGGLRRRQGFRYGKAGVGEPDAKTRRSSGQLAPDVALLFQAAQEN